MNKVYSSNVLSKILLAASLLFFGLVSIFIRVEDQLFLILRVLIITICISTYILSLIKPNLNKISSIVLTIIIDITLLYFLVFVIDYDSIAYDKNRIIIVNAIMALIIIACSLFVFFKWYYFFFFTIANISYLMLYFMLKIGSDNNVFYWITLLGVFLIVYAIIFLKWLILERRKNDQGKSIDKFLV